MKSLNQNSPAAFEPPALGSWLIVFVCGFLTVCILSPVLGVGLWLARLVAQAVKAPVLPAVLDVSMASAVHVLFPIAAVFGALLATVMLLGSAGRKRQEIHLPGHHPVIGDFEHSPFYQTWHAHPVLPTGQTVRLSAQGRSPSAEQAGLWERFIAQFDELSATATDALLTQPHPLEECAEVTLTPSAITLTQDGKLHLGFEFATVPECFWTSENEEPYPTASFTSALKLKSAEWLLPYR